MQVAEEAALPAGEGEVGHGRRHRHVHADHAGLHLADELAGGGAVAGENRRCVAELGGVDRGQRLVEVLHPLESEHRTEDLLAGDRHLGRHGVEQGGPEEEAVAVLLAPVDNQRGALLLALLDVAPDPVQRLARGHGRDRGVRAWAGLVALRGAGVARHPGQAVAHAVGDPAHAHRDGAGQAALARVRERRAEHRGQRRVELRVGHHDEVVLGAGQRLHPLAAQGGALVDLVRHRRRADERDRAHELVIDQRLDRLLGAVHDVEDPVGEAGLGEQLGDAVGGERRALRGLQYERVAGGDRERREPERDHAGEVERRDRADHAEREAVHRHVHAGGDLVERLALHERGHPGRQLDYLDAAAQLAERFVYVLAVLARDEQREVVELILEQHLEAEHAPRPPRDRLVAPRLEGPGGCLDGGVDLLLAREWYLCQQLAAGGGGHGEPPAPAPGRLPPADEVRDVGSGHVGKDYPMRDRVAFVTGASRGIGAAIARLLASEGAKLGLASRSGDELGLDGAIGIECDVTDAAQVDAAVTRRAEEQGRLDVLVNNAGVGAYGPYLELPPEQLEEMVDVTLKGTLYAVRAALPHLLESDTADIVTVASVAGLRGLPKEAVYCASKFGQVGFMRALDHELHEQGVRCTSICPGGVATDFAMGRGRTPDMPELEGMMSGDDVAEAVLFVLTRPRHLRMLTVSYRPMDEPTAG